MWRKLPACEKKGIGKLEAYRTLLDVTNNSLITHQRRRAVVGHFKNDMDLLAGFVGHDKARLLGVFAHDGYLGLDRVCFLILPPTVRQGIAVGIVGSCCVQ